MNRPPRLAIPKDNVRSRRRCNLCNKSVWLRRFERFCTPCRAHQRTVGWVGKHNYDDASQGLPDEEL